MNILKSVLVVSVVALPLFGVAHAADNNAYVPSDVATSTGFYLRGDGGASFLNWSGGKDDVTWLVGGGLGYQFNDNIRTDITGDWSGKYDIAPGAKINTTTVMGNVYYDWANDTAFTPYIGVGAGYGWINGSGVADDAGLALGATAGVSVDMTSNLALDVGYRFRDIMVSGADSQEHQAVAGLRFKF